MIQYTRRDQGDSRPTKLSKDEIAAKRDATAKAMAEAKAMVRQLVEALNSEEASLDDFQTDEGQEILGGRFVREMSLIAALHMGGTTEDLALMFYPGEEQILMGLLAAARKVGWMPRDHFSWHTPHGRKADGSSLVENLRSGLSHAEWEKLAGLMPKVERPSTAATSWDELFAPVEGSRKGFLSLVVEWSEPAKDAKAAKTTEAAKPAGGKLTKLLGRKGTVAPKAEEAPAPAPAKVGLKAKLGGATKVVTAKAPKAKTMSDAELAMRVASGELTLDQAMELRDK